MAGTLAGGKLAAETNKRLYGEDYYRVTGAKGGSAPYHGLKGFAANRERARIAGALGGKISRKGRPLGWLQRSFIKRLHKQEVAWKQK